MNSQETLHVRFDGDTVAAVDHIAQRESRTRNNTVKLLVKEALQHRASNEGQSPEFETINQISKGTAR